ncbi:hypothetical protein Lalb_Chr02g0144981 [Lupinus albus]|uniref:Uncharacterized protein n=1 Tax=Lupinus albus TaxID=3870 RepID=A0A6A4QYW4_LUPAL|nr:hypothetical protein Lalb_Chr02g0144981 [Lupinus albus]
MEGLIPYLIHVIKESESITGSSHRRTRSESLTVEFLEQRNGIDGFLVSPRGPATVVPPTAP